MSKKEEKKKLLKKLRKELGYNHRSDAVKKEIDNLSLELMESIDSQLEHYRYWGQYG